jgi:predicted homoserine dehydrogenase-like protein
MAARAARDLRAGEILGDPGRLGLGSDVTAFLRPGAPVNDDEPLPFFMLEGNRLAVGAPQGTVITANMVEPPQDSVLWTLRRQLDSHFFTAAAN